MSNDEKVFILSLFLVICIVYNIIYTAVDQLNSVGNINFNRVLVQLYPNLKTSDALACSYVQRYGFEVDNIKSLNVKDLNVVKNCYDTVKMKLNVGR